MTKVILSGRRTVGVQLLLIDMTDNLMENLNKEQLEAVLHKDGPLLILAGAGTGKTAVITQRIAYLIEQGRAKSDEILALTFTEKAAGEMEERVDRLLPIGYLDLWISTFHGFCERILNAHGFDIGISPDSKLLNEFEQWALVRKNLDRFNLDYYRPLGNPTKFIHALIKHFSRAKDEDISPAEYLKYAEELKENMDSMLSGGGIRKNSKLETRNSKQIQNTNDKNSKQKGLENLNLKNLDLFRISDFGFRISEKESAGEAGTTEKEIMTKEIARINEVANAYHVYQQLLLGNNAMDFGDLINYTLKLFRERPAILEKYRRQFKYILLDEFQDTNWAQYELVKMIAAPNNDLTVVADDDQSIYAFRGASMSNILHFKEDYPGTKDIVLVNNYRNRQNILDLAYDFIQLNNPNRLEYRLSNDSGRMSKVKGQRSKSREEVDGRKDEKRKLSKKLKAQTEGEGTIAVIEGADLPDEIRKIVEKIAELKIGDKGADWNDFAVLVRANESAKEICAALEAAGLPYVFYSSRGLYAKGVVMDLISYLRMLDNYHESPSLYRVLNLPMFGLSHQELVNLNFLSGKKAYSLYETLRRAREFSLGGETSGKADKVLALIERHSSLARGKTASEVALAFLNDSGYLKLITGMPDAQSREQMSYLDKFFRRIRAFEAASDDRSVRAFLEELSAEIEAGEEGEIAPDLEAGPEAIRVMTAHAAKGLEFKYVFIANMVDRRFPTIERAEPIDLPDALVKEIMPEGNLHLEEERRLFYVAMTRAREGLFFSWAPDYGGTRKKKPSRFLVEAGLLETPGKNRVDTKLRITNYELRIGSKLRAHNIRTDTKEKIEIKPPSYFSYTQLAAFANCPFQYRFAHILKVPRLGKGAFSFGKTMHSTMQKIFQASAEALAAKQGSLFGEADKKSGSASSAGKIPFVFDEIIKVYESCWIDDWYESRGDKEKHKKLGREILRGFYEKHKDDWPRALYLEKNFTLKLKADGKTHALRGAIDRIDEATDGKIKIIDYKTGKPKEKLEAEDKTQLFIYQMAAAEATGREISSLSFYYLENNSEIEFIGGAAELEKARAKIIGRIEEIRKGEFPPKPSQLCRFCDFSGICEFRKAG